MILQGSPSGDCLFPIQETVYSLRIHGLPLAFIRFTML